MCLELFLSHFCSVLEAGGVRECGCHKAGLLYVQFAMTQGLTSRILCRIRTLLVTSPINKLYVVDYK